jgi:prolyl-tRNA editing enzyme YbaK/EbsC (Cys-tRNA(Pro) deacylase)
MIHIHCGDAETLRKTKSKPESAEVAEDAEVRGACFSLPPGGSPAFGQAKACPTWLEQLYDPHTWPPRRSL